MMTRGIQALLLVQASSLLVASWNDYYDSNYHWSVVKAWEAASRATLLADPLGATPLSQRIPRGQPCWAETIHPRDPPLLDSLYRASSDPWLTIALGEDTVLPAKRHALDAIEAAVRILDAASKCPQQAQETQEPQPPPPWAQDALRLGTTLIIIAEDDRPLPDRLTQPPGPLPWGHHTLILTPDEALAYLSLPGPKTLAALGELTIEADKTGTASLIALQAATRNP